MYLTDAVCLAQERWGECAVRIAVRPPNDDELTSFRQPLISEGVPLLWTPPSLVFGSKGAEKVEPTERVFVEFSVRFNAQ